jgi:hypothetical protein
MTDERRLPFFLYAKEEDWKKEREAVKSIKPTGVFYFDTCTKVLNANNEFEIIREEWIQTAKEMKDEPILMEHFLSTIPKFRDMARQIIKEKSISTAKGNDLLLPDPVVIPIARWNTIISKLDVSDDDIEIYNFLQSRRSTKSEDSISFDKQVWLDTARHIHQNFGVKSFRLFINMANLTEINATLEILKINYSHIIEKKEKTVIIHSDDEEAIFKKPLIAKAPSQSRRTKFINELPISKQPVHAKPASSEQLKVSPAKDVLATIEAEIDGCFKVVSTKRQAPEPLLEEGELWDPPPLKKKVEHSNSPEASPRPEQPSCSHSNIPKLSTTASEIKQDDIRKLRQQLIKEVDDTIEIAMNSLKRRITNKINDAMDVLIKAAKL